PAADGAWLAIFAPRSQLVEFVLRERAYKTRMIAEVPRPFWIAPSLRTGRSFYEPLQGGSVKQLGLLKPWAPTLSSGLCVRLDRAFQPVESLHSRADGATHGVTDMGEHQGRVFIAASGDGVVVASHAGTGEEGSLP
ncbi:MAG: strictosidine synthase, partial [Hoeflea sp.]|nr:strictosidine synthase [Hoeflea sp.]